MMEFTGEMLAALNEMLLQSHNRVIRVFPALPDGDRELYRMIQQGYSFHEYFDRYVNYDAWKSVRFDKLLAKGAFEISAQRLDGSLRYIAVYSKKGGRARVACPFLNDGYKVWKDGHEYASDDENGVICFDTDAGSLYFIAREPMTEIPAPDDDSYNTGILTRETFAKRRIFIGEDEDTAYYKALDGFIRCWYLGNVRLENRTVYKFDFGTVADKDYAEILTRQCYGFDKRTIKLLGFNFIGQDALPFTVRRGFGFTDCTGMLSVDRGAPDGLRRDFVEGTNDTEFVIEAPRGQYELLVVSGDDAEDSLTNLEAVNGRAVKGGVMRAGQYQAKVLPLVNEEEEPIRLRISTEKGYKWKINYMMLNAVKGY